MTENQRILSEMYRMRDGKRPMKGREMPRYGVLLSGIIIGAILMMLLVAMARAAGMAWYGEDRVTHAVLGGPFESRTSCIMHLDYAGITSKNGWECVEINP